jgi:phage-related protein/predicted XRE-type DNA-binding protein
LALALRPVIFRDNALEDLRLFPLHSRRDAGYQLDLMQHHRAPDHWKPFELTESGIQEICLADETGVERYMAVLLLDSGIHVLHCYQRTSHKSNLRDAEKISSRYTALLDGAALESHVFAGVWDAIEASPESAQHLRLRSALMRALRHYAQQSDLTRADAVKAFGVSQPRVLDLLRGKVNLFGLEALVSMAACAKLQIDFFIRATE